MNINPAEIKPMGSFAEFVNVSPISGSAVNTFKIAVSENGTQLGWLGQNSGGWAVLVDSGAEAVTLDQYPYNGVTYFRIKDSSRYLSISNNAYVGFYNWIGARGWKLEGRHLVSDENHQKLSIYSTDNAYFYAWDRYTVLDVVFQPQ